MNPIRVSVFAVTILVMGCGVEPQEQGPDKSTATKLNTTTSATGSPRFILELLQTVKGADSETELTLEYEQPHHFRLVRCSSKATGLPDNGIRIPITAVCDGKTVWRVLPGRCHKWILEPLLKDFSEADVYAQIAREGILPFVPANPTDKTWSNEFRAFDATVLRQEMLEGVSTELVEFRDPIGYRCHGWYGIDDGVLRKLIRYTSDGKEWDRFTAKRVALKWDATPNFQFEPAKGVPVEDNTSHTHRALEELKDKK